MATQKVNTPAPVVLDDVVDTWAAARNAGIITCIILVVLCIIFGIYILATRNSINPTTGANRAVRWIQQNVSKIQ
jgi:hypothetical protein